MTNNEMDELVDISDSDDDNIEEFKESEDEGEDETEEQKKERERKRLEAKKVRCFVNVLLTWISSNCTAPCE